mmetsp:Transcript_20245/g.38281  ORF Transcript_20245/g.38281 Transcript_20245/m.38281 type:complete len:171 (-) Transcript_20245:97-609(-)
MMCLKNKLFIACAFAASVLSEAASTQGRLAWQDCGLLADLRGIELLDYRHEPDPIVLGQPYNITRRFRSLLEKPIRNLTERFWGSNRTAPSVWTPSFSNGPFSRCGNQQYQTSCPLAAFAEFDFTEQHPTTHVAQPEEHRAVEYYYADGVFAGCAVIVYAYVNSAEVLLA